MSANRNNLTVKQFAKKHEAFSEGSLRFLIFNSKERKNSAGDKISGNGMIEAGVIARLGRRVLIDEARFFKWIDQQQPESPS